MTPRQVGNYRLDRLLGSGGMGEVYEAYDTCRDRYVALKLLPAGFSGDEEYLKRFQSESQVAAQLREPHVIPIHDFGEIDGRLFVDMRLVDGADLGALLDAADRIDPERAVRLVNQVAQALDAAHAEGLVHRDIKPSNVLVTPTDFVYVVDFGMARSFGGRQTALTMTMTGATAGTPHYMAPERFAGRDVDGRADVYSLACVLHECLAGAPPFAGKDLDAVIARGMAKDPDDRFATAGALAAAASQALLAVASAVADAPPPPPTTEPRLPPGDAPGGPARGISWRRLGALLLVAAAAVAVPVAIVLMVSAKPGTSASRTTSTVGPSGTVIAGPTATGTAVAAVSLPTVAGMLAAGKNPSFVKVAPNGRFAYVADPGAGVVTVLDTATNLVTGTVKIPQGPPQFVSFSPDSRTAYVSVYNPGNPAVHLIAFIDTAAGKVTSTVPVDNFTPGPSTTSPDGRLLYVPNHNTAMSGTGENVVDVIDTATRKLTGHIPVPANPHWVVFSRNGLLLYTTDHMSAKVTVVNAATGRIVASIPVGETPHSEDISPAGGRLAVTSFEGNEVFVINTATDQMIAQVPVGRNPVDIAYSPDGDYLFTVNNEDNTITVIAAADNRVIGTVKTGKAPTSISVLPGGRQAYVTDENDGTIEILDLGS